MNKRLFKQIVSIMLALMLVIGMLPMNIVPALADGEYSEAGPLTGELLLDGESKDVTRVVGSKITLEGIGMGGTEWYE